jgi:hypothetical protein
MKSPKKKQARARDNRNAQDTQPSGVLEDIVDGGGDPRTPSLAYAASLPDKLMVRTILTGTRAIRAAREAYLPRFGEESDADYAYRLSVAPFVNHFRDNLETIVSKPFSKDVALQGEVSDNIKNLAENIDGQGTSLHKFARDMFKESIAQGDVGVLVDFPKVAPNATLADERNMGVRPYWISYRSEDILALYTEFRNGRRYVSHARLAEDVVKPYGFTERIVPRVRILKDDGLTRTWQLWELSDGWKIIDQGEFTLDEIPFRIFKPGEREWWSNATVSPLIDLAYLQIEHYQQSSNWNHCLELAGYPMIAGNGVAPARDASGIIIPLKVGPGAALYAPPTPGSTTSPSWQIIEPAGGSLEQLANKVEKIEQQMAAIGKAPLVRNSGGITATTEAVNAAKGHAAAEAWAIDLKDTLEQLLAFTSAWLNESQSAEIYVHTDFGVDLRENKENSEMMDAHESGEISQDTLWDEWSRRGFLGPQFERDKERIAIEKEKKQRLKDQVELMKATAGAQPQPGGPGGFGGKKKKKKRGGDPTLYAKDPGAREAEISGPAR